MWRRGQDVVVVEDGGFARKSFFVVDKIENDERRNRQTATESADRTDERKAKSLQDTLLFVTS